MDRVGKRFVIDRALVSALLADQHPDLAELLVGPGCAGWDNATFRLGENLAVRLPHRPEAAALLLAEQRWLPLLAPRLPLPIPVPQRIGLPGRGYPWNWSVVAWMQGQTAAVAPPDAASAADLGAFLAALHVPAPADAPVNPFRGCALAARAGSVARRLQQIELGDAQRRVLQSAWDQLSAAPIDTAPTWIHADLHPHNVVTSDGRISAVIDWGDLSHGDLATDLAAAWMLFDPAAHAAFRAAYIKTGGAVSATTWDRARGWALFFGIMLTGFSGDPSWSGIAQRTLARVLE